MSQRRVNLRLIRQRARNLINTLTTISTKITNIRCLYSWFEVYCAVLLAIAYREAGYTISLENLHGGQAIFKTSTQGKNTNYCFFRVIDQTGRHEVKILLNTYVRSRIERKRFFKLCADVISVRTRRMEPPKDDYNALNVEFAIEAKSYRVYPQLIALIEGIALNILLRHIPRQFMFTRRAERKRVVIVSEPSRTIVILASPFRASSGANRHYRTNRYVVRLITDILPWNETQCIRILKRYISLIRGHGTRRVTLLDYIS